jgi:benzoate membrane transport protein
MRVSLLSAALVAALVGFGSTIALILAAAQAVGASPAQTASWVLAISLAMGLGSAALSLGTRLPMVLAWSTPGAALIAATDGIDVHQAVGAFVLAGLLIAAMGLVRPLGALVARIPDAVAAGMLAGVLLPFVLEVAPAAVQAPALVLPHGRGLRAGAAAQPAWRSSPPSPSASSSPSPPAPRARPPPAALPALTLIAPALDGGTVLGLALPLALVTMASQNLTGFATLRAAGFAPPSPWR